MNEEIIRKFQEMLEKIGAGAVAGWNEYVKALCASKIAHLYVSIALLIVSVIVFAVSVKIFVKHYDYEEDTATVPIAITAIIMSGLTCLFAIGNVAYSIIIFFAINASPTGYAIMDLLGK